MRKIVLDTASFVTAIRSSEGAAREVVAMIYRRDVIALMDLKLGLEYRDVALRPEHLDASEMNEHEVLSLIETLETVSKRVEVSLKIRPLSSDPDDDMVLDLAINGRAECIITNNTKHFISVGRRFGIAVLTPAAYLARIKKGSPYGD